MNLLRRAAALGFPAWLGIILGFCAAFAWMMVGGIPRGIDHYGVVPIPGRQVVNLPAGRVLLDHFDDVNHCFDGKNHAKNASIPRVPAGTTVTVTAQSPDSASIPVTRRSDVRYVGITGCRGHDPFGRIDVPRAGPFDVTVKDAEHKAGNEPLTTTASTSGPGISFGKPPWTPLGVPLIGAVLAAVVVGVVGWRLAELLWGD
ncbi:MAG: hypothetical protein ACJ71Z_13795 [Aeromicrobium sp.]